MLKQLKEIFPSLIIYPTDLDHFSEQYKWFSTDENDIIGINKEELTTKDRSLLNTFLSPYNTDIPILTKEEQQWRDRINYPDETREPLKSAYRFVYFSIQKNKMNPTAFKDAIQELLAKQVPILWENGNEGIIIEEQTNVDDSISYEDIIDLLMSDLYVKINFFVGPFQKTLDNIQRHYHSLLTGANTIFFYSKKSVVTYIESVPFLIISQLDQSLKSDISETVLQEYLHDEDTLKMIETFVQCNLNISETAKELYMHRNSLQYRLDRFFEKTSIDIRQFTNAITVYLALLAKN